MVDKAIALKLIANKPWHHDFEIVPGVRTRGAYNPIYLWNQLQLPEDLTGLSVADVGASNGYFSFEARKRGARVVAFDFRHKDNSGFGLAQYINGMNDIEHHQINVLDLHHEEYGQFDVVLALGLLYHVSDPYRALANCAGLSKKRLLIESHCLDPTIPAELTQEPIMKFISDPTRFPMYGHLNNDPSNFWAFTSTCLRRMVEDVGFTPVKLSVQHDRILIDSQRGTFSDRGTRLPLAYGSISRVTVGPDLNDPEAWVIF